MLRVGLTGGVACGKSTVAQMLVDRGAHFLAADSLAHDLYAPGEPTYDKVVSRFGCEILNDDGAINRSRLANLVFPDRIDELNAIVHPAVIEQQRQWMEEVFARDPKAVAVVVSALIFEVERDARARGETEGVLADWRRRMDRVILVTAPDELKVRRYVDRLGLPEDRRVAAESDARARLGHQIRDADKTARADYVLENHGDREALRALVKPLWEQLAAESNKRTARGFLE